MRSAHRAVPFVSVVIPTAGKRPAALLEAIGSVARQDIDHALEIVVVDDSNDGLDVDALTSAAAGIPLIITPPMVDIGQRSAGVSASQGHWIAFLDDDDLWEPSKLREQVGLAAEIEARGRLALVSTRLQHSFADSDRIVRGIPTRIIRPGDDIGTYLFYKREPSVHRSSLYTSTLLASRSLCTEVEWKRLPRHQDWDWLLRVAGRPDVEVVHHPAVLTTIHVGSVGSISASPDWESSMRWAATDARPFLSRKVYADFLCAQVLRYALNARSVRGTKTVLAEMLRNRRVPSMRGIVVGLAGLMPRKGIQKLMSMATRGSRARATGDHLNNADQPS